MSNRRIDIKELSDYLAIKAGTIYAWVHTKQIPHYKIGRLVRFELSEIEKWLEEKSVKVYN
ncbi:MAG: helix-turn-helix domain-containing protein [Candidatus Omnitrophica bacterium]|nr:helix-turn-helix domain-containing protein [Candidatus Omnitrophota bacterium]